MKFSYSALIDAITGGDTPEWDARNEGDERRALGSLIDEIAIAITIKKDIAATTINRIFEVLSFLCAASFAAWKEALFAC